MSGLVGYASSDEEDDVQPGKPAKIAKLGHNVPVADNDRSGGRLPSPETIQIHPHSTDGSKSTASTENGLIESQVASAAATTSETSVDPTSAPLTGPAVIAPTGPSEALSDDSLPDPDDEPPMSPYSSTRQRLRDLTMPTIPNFAIPDAPMPPVENSEEAAVLAATAKKFTRFLDLKKKGVHFNDRLRSSSSLQNPSLPPKLMEFAGISEEDSYASTLPKELAVPVKWPEEAYYNNLVKANDRREKKKRTERDKVDFVPASSAGKDEVTKKTSRFDRQ